MTVEAQKARSIFLAAVENHAPAQWQAFINEACAGDNALRQRVEALLRGHAAQIRLVDQPPVPAAASPAVNRPHIGTMLGKYLLKRLLGEGGMGVVYEAQDTQLLRPVAVKLLSQRLADRERLMRFQREAQAAAQLNHPNVVAVYDSGVWEKWCFIAMELVRGESLQEIVDRRGALPWRDALNCGADVCRGLAAAHGAGLLHRDIKPGNVLRALDGSIKIVDFGVAKFMADNLPRLTVLNSTVGTPTFMSPEQCRGEVLDGRTDVYSLGATLFVLLTGTPPFVGENDVAMLEAHCSVPVPDVCLMGPKMPPACAALIRKAMAKDQGERFASAEEMLGDLTRILSAPWSPPSIPVARPAAAQAVTPTPPESLAPTVRMPRPAERRVMPRYVIFVAIAAALMLLMAAAALGIGVYLLTRKAPSAAPLAKAQMEPEATAQIDAGGLRLRFMKKWQAHDAAVTALAFAPVGERIYSAGLDESVRCWEAEGEVERWRFAKKVNALAITPNGKLLAAGGEAGDVHAWNPLVDEPQPILQVGGQIRALEFAPNGGLLAVGYGGGFQVWEQRDESKKFVHRFAYPKPQHDVSALAFAPDGKSVAWVNRQQELHVLDTSTWQARIKGEDQPGLLAAVVFAGDNKTVYFGGRRQDNEATLGVLRRWTIGLGEARDLQPPCVVRSLALYPKGRTLAVAGEGGAPLRLYELPAGPMRTITVRSQTAVQVLRFSPQGDRLVAGCENGEIHIWAVE